MKYRIRCAVLLLAFVLAAAFAASASGASGSEPELPDYTAWMEGGYDWIEDGLVYHNPFDEGEGDTAAATVGGTPAVLNRAVWIDGISGKGVATNGLSSFVTIDWNLGTLSRATISVWACIRSINDSNSGVTIMASQNTSESGHFYMGYQWNWPFRFNVYRRWGDYSISPDWVSYLEIRRRWVHYAVTYDTTRGMARYFIDGMLLTEGGTSSNLRFDPVSLGAIVSDGKGTEFSQIFIDELRIYDRALSSDEIAMLAAGGYPPDMSEVWPLSEEALNRRSADSGEPEGFLPKEASVGLGAAVAICAGLLLALRFRKEPGML